MKNNILFLLLLMGTSINLFGNAYMHDTEDQYHWQIAHLTLVVAVHNEMESTKAEIYKTVNECVGLAIGGTIGYILYEISTCNNNYDTHNQGFGKKIILTSLLGYCGYALAQTLSEQSLYEYACKKVLKKFVINWLEYRNSMPQEFIAFFDTLYTAHLRGILDIIIQDSAVQTMQRLEKTIRKHRVQIG